MAELFPSAADTAPQFHQRPLRWLDRVVVTWALAGGLVFCAIVIMSIVSIVGRKLFSSPIQGDVELLQMGAAVASASFLALCELHDQHIKVDAVTTRLGERLRGSLDVAAHGLMAGVSGLISWRCALYAHETQVSAEVSTLLLIPLWWPVSLLVPSFVLLTLAALVRTGMALTRVIRPSVAPTAAVDPVLPGEGPGARPLRRRPLSVGVAGASRAGGMS